jgi:hypothetical protein
MRDIPVRIGCTTKFQSPYRFQGGAELAPKVLGNSQAGPSTLGFASTLLLPSFSMLSPVLPVPESGAKLLVVAWSSGHPSSLRSKWGMPEDGKEDLPFETYCDLIERELREALKDIAAMRDNQSEAKRHCVLVRAALENARYYLLELKLSLWAELWELVESIRKYRKLAKKTPLTLQGRILLKRLTNWTRRLTGLKDWWCTDLCARYRI